MPEAAAVPKRRRRQTAIQHGEQAASAQYSLFRDLPVPCVALQKPAQPPERADAEPREAEPEYAPARDPCNGRFSKIPAAIIEVYTPLLGDRPMDIYRTMHHMMRGCKPPPRSKAEAQQQQGWEQGEISYDEIARLLGVSPKTVQRHMPTLIKAGLVERTYKGRHRGKNSVYKLNIEAPMPSVVRYEKAVQSFPEPENGGQNVRRSASSNNQATPAPPPNGGQNVPRSSLNAGQNVRRSERTYKEEERTKKETTSSRSSNRAVAPANGAVSAVPVQAKADVDLGEWLESAEAIREEVPTLNDKNLGLIFAKARQVKPAVTDAELAAAARRDEGRNLRAIEKYRRHPVVWGYELVCLALERRKRTTPAPTWPDEPHDRDAEESPPIEASGRVRLGPLCRKHGIRVVSCAKDGSEACVYCKPPDDPRVKAEARQMVERLTEAQPQAP